MIFIVTTLNFKDIVDLPKWRPLAQPITLTNTNYGLTSDLRNNEDRHPFIYFNTQTTTFNAYNVKNDEWLPLTSPLLASALTSGFFMSAQGPRGTIAAGATTTTLTLTTALPATVGVNQLANRGDGRGFKVRIIGNAAGSSGKTEERLVVANTSGTTPTIVLDSPLSFSPILGDAYEFLSGRVFMLGGTNVAGSWKYYDVLTNSFSGNLATANLPASWTASNLVGLDELLVPYDRSPGEGFFGVLTATATGAASLTGQLVGGDCGVPADMHRNFQIRIVQDIATPLAVGQRRNISTHTAGTCGAAAPIYTLSVAWTTQPSATAQYVIENNGDRIIAWFSASSNTNTYTISTNAWDVAGTIFINRTGGVLGTALMSCQAFSIEPDVASPPNARHSFIYQFMGTGTVTLDVFDIAGGASGSWTNAITYGNSTILFSTQASSTQDPATMQGRYMYIDPAANAAPINQRMYRFDMKNRILEQSTFLRILPIVTTTGTSPKRLAYTVFVDGNTKLSFIFYNIQNNVGPAQLMFGLPIIR